MQRRAWAAALVALLGSGSGAAIFAARGQYLTQEPAPGDPLETALRYLESQRGRLGLAAGDLAAALVTDRYASRHNGVTHLYLRQRHAGVEVANANLAIHVARDGRILDLSGAFVPDLATAVNRTAPVLGPEAAILAAADQFGLVASETLREVGGGRTDAGESRFAPAGLSREEIPVRLAYYWTDAGRGRDVRLAWELVLRLPDQTAWWHLWVDAADGRVLAKVDWMAHDSYEVFAIPLENPDQGPRTVELDPADALASPFGWHDTNGVAGAEFNDTRGNNAFAQEDRDANNTGGFRPSGGATRDFLFPLDLTQPPVNYQSAAIANLFYWNNAIHDVYYHYGFDEPAGNFQENNYGNGGAASDPVQADAQDGSGTNNANFSTPPDGLDARMQMFEWTFPFPNLVEVFEGAAIGVYTASGAAFGPAFTLAGVSADLVLATDSGGTDGNDGCEALTNGGAIAGNLAVMNRGTCTFVTKVRNAQNAGATAAVIVNNVAGSPVTMGDDGTGFNITIPSAMISLEDGNLIKPTLPAAGNARAVGGEAPPSRDSDLDNGVIVHEYTHGLSNRLTGGPNNTSCLGNQEQPGEGWSDWYALALTAKATDTAAQARGIGNYVVFQGPTGNGIRTYPYSTDLAINPHTYDAIKTAAIPHGVGSVWAAMLWEVYWNLVGAYGFDADLYTGTGGNNLALQLVTDGMKLQPCSPDFVDARDAILDADLALTGGANQCLLWEGFAKRGLGFSADAGSPNSVTDGTEAFDLPAECVGPRLSAPDPGMAGQRNCYELTGATPGGEIALVMGLTAGSITPPGCTVAIEIGDPSLRDSELADALGNTRLCTRVPAGASGRTLLAQAVDRSAPGCAVSNVDVTTYR